jgi:hypothetical protein
MQQSVLEMTTERVITHLATYHQSFDQVVQMLKSTHARQLRRRRQGQNGSQGTLSAKPRRVQKR